MKIVIDAFGGDNAPKEIIMGAIKALFEFDNITIVLTGDEKKINEVLTEMKSQPDFVNFDEKRLEIVDCKQVITNDEKPTQAIRQKKDSSMVKGFDLLKNDKDVIGFISAGSTGAVLTGSFLKIGRMQGVSRPTLCPALPTKKGTPVILVDSGANMDCKPINLLHFAVLGSKYYQCIFGEQKPRVAILNVGAEDEKGNELVKQTLPYMKKLPINFVGSVEARDFLSGDYDVVVCDGFAGNVLLKASEGAVITIMDLIKTALKEGNWINKLGAAMIKKPLKSIVKKFDYSNYGGSPFLGIEKIVIKAHGSSKANSIFECVKQVIHLYKSDCYKKVQTAISKLKINLPTE